MIKDCPYCGTACHVETVDIGVGSEQCAPCVCECGAVEIGPFDDWEGLTPEEWRCGWYRANYS